MTRKPHHQVRAHHTPTRASGLGTDRSQPRMEDGADLDEARGAALLATLGTVVVLHSMRIRYRHCLVHRGFQLLLQAGKEPWAWAQGTFLRDGMLCADTLLGLARSVAGQFQGALAQTAPPGVQQLGAVETFAELSSALERQGVGNGVLTGVAEYGDGYLFELRGHNGTLLATGPTLRALAAAARGAQRR